MGEDALSVRPTWFTRLLRGVGLLPSGEVEFEAGADFASSQPASPGYPKGDALSAYAAFPWVYSCVDAISSDLSGLPLIAIRGTGANAERLESHPVLDLLGQPSTRVSAQLWRKQMICDYVLTGDAYSLIAGEREPSALLRLIPQRVTVKPWSDGQPGSYLYDSGGKQRSYSWEEVIHIRSPSWEDDPSNLFGTGAVRPLDHDLRTELASIKSAEETAKTGRPSGIISPSEDGDRWSAEQVKRIRQAYSKQMSGKSGILILGGAARFDSLSLTPRDLEFSKQRQLTREATLATFSVPPTRVGLPTANYATSREQAKVYWQTLQARATFLDVELSRLAKLFPNSEDVRVVHDFSAVEALQESRSERVDRVRKWYDMGLPLADAAAFEGFEELPTFDLPEEPVPEASQEESETLRALFSPVNKAKTEPPNLEALDLDGPSRFASWFSDVDDDDDDEGWRASPMPVTREQRVEVWKSYIERLHGPTERAMMRAFRTFLKKQSKRYASRLRKVTQNKGITRSISDQDLDLILEDQAERMALAQVARPLVTTALMTSYRTALKQMGAGDKVFDPTRLDDAIKQGTGELVENVSKPTRAAVRLIINEGFAESVTIAEMQRALMASKAFDAARALRIARTESTRNTNLGSIAAMSSASDLGVPVRKMWISAGDAEVREAHQELDGQYVFADEAFSSTGGSPMHPGGFGEASEDINCRCNLIPFIDEEDAADFKSERDDMWAAQEATRETNESITDDS